MGPRLARRLAVDVEGFSLEARIHLSKDECSARRRMHG
jgi:hypothetical protein